MFKKVLAIVSLVAVSSCAAAGIKACGGTGIANPALVSTTGSMPAKTTYPTATSGPETVTIATIATDPTPVVITKAVPVNAAPVAGSTLGSSELAQQNADLQSIMSKNDAYVAKLVRDGVDLRALPRREFAASMAPLPASLDDLTARAAYIVDGIVAELDIAPNKVIAEVLVKDVAKGRTSAGAVLRVTTGELLTPNADYTGAVLGVLPTYPGVVEGDEAVFLLANTKSGLEAISGADTLILRGGVVVSNSGNPFDTSVRGLTAAQVLTKLRS